MSLRFKYISHIGQTLKNIFMMAECVKLLNHSCGRRGLTNTTTGFGALRDHIMDVFWSLNRGVHHDGLFRRYKRTSSVIGYNVPTYT